MNGKWDANATSGGGGFENWITKDGSPGPKGQRGFKAEKDRYVLYVAYGCPFAQRAHLIYVLKKLENVIKLQVTNPTVPQRSGWTFDTKFPGTTGDTINHFKYASEIYLQSDPNYTGRVTVPILYDTKEKVIVNNESAQIVEILNSAFSDFGADTYDYVPASETKHIEEITSTFFKKLGGPIYQALLATSQADFDAAQEAVFDGLEYFDKELESQRYISGPKITAADINFFVILVRLPVQLPFAKLLFRRLQDYHNLWNYTKDLYQSGFGKTVFFDHIVAINYAGRTLDADGILPRAPELDLTSPHGRENLDTLETANSHRDKYI